MPNSINQLRAISTILFLLSTSKASVSEEELKNMLSLLSADIAEAVDDIERTSA